MEKPTYRHGHSKVLNRRAQKRFQAEIGSLRCDAIATPGSPDPGQEASVQHPDLCRPLHHPDPFDPLDQKNPVMVEPIDAW